VGETFSIHDGQEVHTKYLLEKLRERDHMGRLSLQSGIIRFIRCKMIFRWLKIRSSGQQNKNKQFVEIS
jgi:hypothetical protein